MRDETHGARTIATADADFISNGGRAPEHSEAAADERKKSRTNRHGRCACKPKVYNLFLEKQKRLRRSNSPEPQSEAIESVLLTGRRRALGERPHAVGELEHQEAVVLTGRPQRAAGMIQMHLGRAPVGPACTPLTDRRVIGADGRRRGAGRIEI